MDGQGFGVGVGGVWGGEASKKHGLARCPCASDEGDAVLLVSLFDLREKHLDSYFAK